MRTGNPIDGAYFLLLVVPFLLSFWLGDFLRKKIEKQLVLQSYFGQNISILIGILAEILIIVTGVSTGFLLIKLVWPDF